MRPTLAAVDLWTVHNRCAVHDEQLTLEKCGRHRHRSSLRGLQSPNGKPLSVTDANGNRAEMRWDGLDRQKRWTFPSKTTPGSADPADYEEYGYDANANRTSLRKRDGSTLGYQYDALNRMTVKLVPERAGLTAAHTRDVYYGYDNRGLQTQARFDSLAGEGIANLHDGFGRLVSSTSDMGGTARTTGNLYDPNGNRIRVIHPDGSYFTYELDGDNSQGCVPL